MAVKIPIVYDDAGGLQQLQSGDTIPGGGDTPSEFPDWTLNGDQWEDTQNALIDQYNTVRVLGGSNYSSFGTLNSDTGKWIGGVLATNNCIYGIPYNATSVLKIDTSDDTVSTFGSVSGVTKYWGGVLAPNGNIYCIPLDATNVLKIDTVNDTVSTIGSLSGSGKWCGGVLGTNNCVYGIPYGSTSVLRIDTSNDAITTFGSLSGATKWIGGVLTPSGNICGVPFSSAFALDIDTANDAAATFGPSISGVTKWRGGVIGITGAVYGIAATNTASCRVDLDAGTVSFLEGNLTSTGQKWAGGCLAPDGKINGALYNRDYRLVIDPVSEANASLFTTFSASATFEGLVLAPNGHMYGIPRNSTAVYKLSTSFGDLPVDFCLSRYFNKY